jgi:uncharacterized membrane protein
MGLWSIIMAQDRTRKIAVTGVLGAISAFLGITHLGYWVWFSGASFTIMHIPVIIGGILEGPVVGMLIGLIFGVTSLIQAAIAPTGPTDVWFTNPLLSVLPRLFIGPAAWAVWVVLKRWPVIGLIAAGIAGSLTNTILVLGMIVVLGYAPLAAVLPVVVINGLPEAAASVFITLVLVGGWLLIRVGRRKGSNL